jgi:hypothetical protein
LPARALPTFAASLLPEENTKGPQFSQDSSYLKGILDVYHLRLPGAIENADDVKSEVAAGGPLARHPIPRRTRHFPLLSPVHGAKRPAIPRGHSRLDLDERNQESRIIRALDNEIYIAVTTPESPLDNSPASLDQPLLCDPLASFSKLLPCC